MRTMISVVLAGCLVGVVGWVVWAQGGATSRPVERGVGATTAPGATGQKRNEGWFRIGERRFAAGGVVRLRSATISGVIEVEVHKAPEVVVRYRQCLRADGQPYRTLRLRQQNGWIEAGLEPSFRQQRWEPGPRCGFYVSYHVSVPAGTTVHLHTVSGALVVRQSGGLVKAKSVSGAITISGAGQVQARAVSGAIVVRQVADVLLHTVSGGIQLATAQGKVELQSVSGRIHAEQLQSMSSRLTSISGAIRLQNSKIGALQIQSQSGKIHLEGTMTGNTWQIQSFSGAMMLRLRAKEGFWLAAQTMSGQIICRLPLQEKQESQFGLQGRYGQGKGRLRVKGFSGNIAIAPIN